MQPVFWECWACMKCSSIYLKEVASVKKLLLRTPGRSKYQCSTLFDVISSCFAKNMAHTFDENMAWTQGSALHTLTYSSPFSAPKCCRKCRISIHAVVEKVTQNVVEKLIHPCRRSIYASKRSISDDIWYIDCKVICQYLDIILRYLCAQWPRTV